MCLNYRMNRNNSSKKRNTTNLLKNNSVNVAPVASVAPVSESKGFFNSITNMFSSNSSTNAQKGGSVFVGAPVNYRYPDNMQQPTREVLEWATTAGAPMPLSGMKNVAHGGRRRTRKHKSHKYKRNNKYRHKRSKKNKHY